MKERKINNLSRWWRVARREEFIIVDEYKQWRQTRAECFMEH